MWSRNAKGKTPPLGIASKVSLRFWLLPLLIKEPRRNLSPCPLLEATLLAAVPMTEVWDQMKATTMAGTIFRSPVVVTNLSQIPTPTLVAQIGTRTRLPTNLSRILGRLDRTNSILSKAISRRSC